MAIRVQTGDFDISAETAALTRGRDDIGAVVSFTGLVRGGGDVSQMELEHYPGMTENALRDIESRAVKRWNLQASTIVHRVGPLQPGEQIVLVLAASPHRQDAFDAANFMMDYLKTRAPFWKKETGPAGGKWVDARDADDDALLRWDA